MSKDSNTQGDYEVGYGKPPKGTRFVPGHSGHHRRQPQPKDLRTILLNALNERVNITENGVRKRITKLEAINKRLVNKAAAGEVGAIKYLNRRLQESDDDGGQPYYFKFIGDET